MPHSSNKVTDSLWTIDELGEYLKVRKSVIRFWIRTNALPHIKLGKHIRFDPHDVRRWLARKKTIMYLDDTNIDLKRIR